MLEPLAEPAAIAWPVALSVASVSLVSRRRTMARRRALNRALHELRRPLQAMILAAERPAASEPASTRHLDLALDALAELDHEINGRPRAPARRTVADGRSVAIAAARRWRPLAVRAGRALEEGWLAGGALLLCDPARLGRALDNLIANALEHGAGTITVAGELAGGRLRLIVADEGRWSRRPSAGRPDRGHGLAVVEAIAEEHSGRFELRRTAAGTRASIELPIAG